MTTSGFIYAIGVESSPYIKIGCTRTDVTKRLAQLQTGQPERLTLLASVPVADNLFDIEGRIHIALAAYRHDGEWFTCAVTPAHLDALVRQAEDSLCRVPIRGGVPGSIDDILEDGTLSTSKKMLLIAIAYETDNANGAASLSLRRFKHLCSLSLSSVCLLLSELEADGYLIIGRGYGPRRGNVYTINRALLCPVAEVAV